MPTTSRRLVLITGTGRSGTSTMSGMFHHLGVEVPGPHIGANETNPRGFFESRWSVRFHNRICERARVHLMDARPEAFDLVQAAVTGADRARLRWWLEKVSEGQDQFVVKDPRTTWTQQLWREVAADQGIDVVFISMLRHPAEVIGSRSTYYASKDAELRWVFETSNVAKWINSSLISERETRGQSRSFVRYDELLADWRSVARRLHDELGVEFAADLSDGVPNPVDDFIAPDLRRVRVGWDDLEVPVPLSDLAEETWQALQALRAGELSTADSDARFDALSARYALLMAQAAAISEDTVRAARLEAADAARAELATDLKSDAGRERPVAEVPTRQLLRIATGRVLRRFRRRTADGGEA